MARTCSQSEHNIIQDEILAACHDLGLQARREYSGGDWMADVLVVHEGKKFAFEIQLAPQSLEKTMKRQAKYIRDGIVGCWLFLKPPKLSAEIPDLPLFQVTKTASSSFVVSAVRLGDVPVFEATDPLEIPRFTVSLDRHWELPLRDFVGAFLSGRIRFSPVIRALPKQRIQLVFFEMACWGCKATNHVYYVDFDSRAFRTACGASIEPVEGIPGSSRAEFRPEIIRFVMELVKSEQGRHLKIGEIKKRFSRTTQCSYISFGCYRCDRIFGDWFVTDAMLEAAYGYGVVDRIECEIRLEEEIELPVPHWCYPGEFPFCDASG